MIKNIIFDWGGVLAPRDNELAATLLSEKYDLNEKDFIRYFDEHEDKYCVDKIYAPLLVGAEKKFHIPQIEILNALNSAGSNEIYDIVFDLSKDFNLYLLSNQPKYRADYIKANNDLSLFTKTFFSCDIGLKKPDLEIFTYFLNKNKLDPSSCLFVDDRDENIQAAKKSGMGGYLFESVDRCKLFLQSIESIK